MLCRRSIGCEEYTITGQMQPVLRLLRRFSLSASLEQDGSAIDECVGLLKRCGDGKDLAQGRRVHAGIVSRGLDQRKFIANHVVQMYGKCASPQEARAVFDGISRPNVVSWTNMIVAYLRAGCGREALELYHTMNVPPNMFTYSSLLSACALVGDVAEGKAIHARIVRDHGMKLDRVVATALVDMYAKCGVLEDARDLFDRIQDKTVVSWTAMMTGYIQNELCAEAIQLYKRMALEGVEPDVFIFSSVIYACASINALAEGRAIHSRILGSGKSNFIVETAIMGMYAKCGSLEDAKNTFDSMHCRDLVTWTAMVEVYVAHGCSKEGLGLFRRMNLEGLKPDKATFISILNAFNSMAKPEVVREVKTVHSWIAASGHDITSPNLGNALINLYSNCGSLEDARATFLGMKERTIVSWNSMIFTLGKFDHGREALELYSQMESAGVVPEPVTFTSILGVCAGLGALAEGRAIHSRILDLELDADGPVGNALVNMYTKCGSLADAKQVFDKMHQRNVVGWTAMIVAYAQHGHSWECLEQFQLMKLEGGDPDEVTFTGLLHACSHAGLLVQGWKYLISMREDHGLEPTGDHYASMVDLLARSGRLEAAEELIRTMPFQPDELGWSTLLGASRVQGDVERGQRAAEHALEVAPSEESTTYVLLSNLYAETSLLKSREINKNRK